MRNETSTLGDLARAVDDARLFCIDASAHATRPWLKRTWERLAPTHALIASELRACIAVGGPHANARRDRSARTWRTTWSGWLARNHFDSDLAYLQQAERQESRLSRRFVRAARRTPAGSTHWRLQRHRHQIDHARTNIAKVIAIVQQEIDARRLEAHAAAGLAAPSRPVARPRRDAGA